MDFRVKFKMFFSDLSNYSAELYHLKFSSYVLCREQDPFTTCLSDKRGKWNQSDLGHLFNTISYVCSVAVHQFEAKPTCRAKGLVFLLHKAIGIYPLASLGYYIWNSYS